MNTGGATKGILWEMKLFKMAAILFKMAAGRNLIATTDMVTEMCLIISDM